MLRLINRFNIVHGHAQYMDHVASSNACCSVIALGNERSGPKCYQETAILSLCGRFKVCGAIVNRLYKAYDSRHTFTLPLKVCGVHKTASMCARIVIRI